MRQSRFSLPAASGAPVALLLAACLAGCGQSDTVPPVEVAQNYVYTVAEGNYAGACALMNSRTRESLVRSMGSPATCAAVFTRCMPRRSKAPSQDQSQLLYANVVTRASGAQVHARLSGTPVARATGEVTLVKKHGRWELTSYGEAIRRCVLQSRRDERRGRSARRSR